MLGVHTKPVVTAFFSEEEEFRAAIDDIMKITGRDDFTVQELQDYMVDKLKLPNWNKTKVKNTINRWAFHTNQLRELGAPGSMEFTPIKKRQKTLEES